MLLFPKRRLRLEPIDQKRRRIQRRAPMRRGSTDEHDALAGT
jgi:hypothetical protein